MVLGTEQVGQIAEDDVQTMFDTNVLGLISLTQIFVNGELCASFLSIFSPMEARRLLLLGDS